MAKITIWNVTINHRHMEGPETTSFSTLEAAKKFAADHAREQYSDHLQDAEEEDEDGNVISSTPLTDDEVLETCWNGYFMQPANGSIEVTERRVTLPDDPVRDAAPDMLAALKALKEWASIMGGWDAACWQDADRAIAKAEGRAA